MSGAQVWRKNRISAFILGFLQTPIKTVRKPPKRLLESPPLFMVKKNFLFLKMYFEKDKRANPLDEKSI